MFYRAGRLERDLTTAEITLTKIITLRWETMLIPVIHQVCSDKVLECISFTKIGRIGMPHHGGIVDDGKTLFLS